ncbi:hypothetical protein ACQKOH_08700 [Sphingomonas sp. NPDC092331]
MIDRGNGARASKAVPVRVDREALLREALLGSTALIGVALATPALAQSTYPAGGGTISGTGTYTDATATNGGVTVTNTVNAGVIMADVTINNTTGDPNGIAYKQVSAGGQSAVLYTAGANTLRSDQNGAALSLQAANGNVTWAIGQSDESSTTDLTATYGAYLIANGFVNVVDFGTVSSLRNVTADGAGVAGIYASSSGSTVNLSLKAPVISGFATGISAISAAGAIVTTTGGSISTLPSGTGISATASNAGAPVMVSSGSAISTSIAGVGINASSNNSATSVITTAGGTINGGSVGIQVNAALTGQSSVVTVGAAIGNSTRPSSGVVFQGTGVVGGTNTVNANANVSSGTGFSAIGSNTMNSDLAVNVASGVTVTSQGSFAIRAGRNITVVNNGTVSATSGAGTGVSNAQAPSTLSVTNNGAMSAGRIVVDGQGTTNVTNAGTITATNFAAISSGRGGTITNNAGATITGGSDTSSGWGILFQSSTFSAGQTVTNNGTITGGGAGAIRLDATTASLFNLNAGSTTNGLIRITGSGATTTNLGGTLNGNYDASAATGAQNFTLGATGAMQGATFGSGNDIFTWGGGSIGGTIDGGTGTDTFAVDLGSTTNRTIDQSSFFANIVNFEAYNLVSGNLTLTGSSDGGPGWTVAGGNATALTINGALTNVAGNAVTLTTADLMFIKAGAQVSATGDVIYSTATGNNIQNSGTITSGTGMSSGIAIGSGTVDNFGLITYAAGGSSATQGNGVFASANQLTLTNHAGASIYGRWDGARANNGAYVTNDGLIQGDRFAGLEISGTSVVFNNATGRIYGATSEGAGVLINSGAVQVTNASGGQIVGAGYAGIYNGGTGLLSVSNAGKIATGTLDGSNNYVQGGTTTAIRSASANITNSGLIEGASGGIQASGALTLVNTGMIHGSGTGTLNLDAVYVGGAANILNAGTISEGTGAAIHANGGGTITNAVGATLGGGNNPTSGTAVFLNGGTFNNYGQAGSGTGTAVVTDNAGGTINLFAGSASGSITGGAGNDTLAIYNGQTNASAVTQSYTDAVSGTAGSVTLQNSGTLAAAMFGAIDLGGGNNTLQLRGAGTGAQAGSFSLATSTGAGTITKLDGGTWTLTGAAIVPGITVNANGGMLNFQGTSGVGTINVNGGILRANGAGAFGSAAVHMLTSNVQFGASGVYANSFVLDIPAVLNGQPVVFENLFGGNAILSGNISSGSGTNAAGQAIGTSQAVTFAGIGGSLFNLTGTNSWTGTTTINSGVTARGSTTAISGSNIVNNGTVTYAQSGSSSSGTVISGTGALRLESGQVTLTGSNTYTGGTTVAGGRLQVGDGTTNGRITGAITVDSGGTLVFNRNDNYDFTSAISGAGDVQALGTITLSGPITNTGALYINSATGGTVTLTGARSGAYSGGATAAAVTLGGANNILRVGLSGTVAGGQYLGVYLGGTGNGVDNFGTISNTGTALDQDWGSAIGVAATSGSSIINNGSASNATATINGRNTGINHLGSDGVIATGQLSVNNYGLIASNLANAIENQNGSGNLTVTNYGTGRIVGQGNAGGTNGYGIYAIGTGTLGLTNAGLIVGRVGGVLTGSATSITNSGTIAAGTLSGGTSGTLVAGGGNGIQTVGGTITNQAGGVIRGSFLGGNGDNTNAITSTAATTVNNSGQILGVAFGSTSNVRTNGVYVSGGAGTVTNYATGLITGGWDGVYVTAGGTVTNSGTIAGYQYYGVENASTLTNNAGGRLLGVAGGASMLADGIVNNSGLIAAATYNATTDTYTLSAGTGLTLSSGSVSNQYNGTVTGAVGIGATGALSLGNAGTITATTYAGVNLLGTGNTIYNGGTITGGTNATLGYGVRFVPAAGGTLNNQSGGLISGTAGGVYSGSASVSVDNGGNMVGTGAGSRGVYQQFGNAVVTNQASGVIVGQGWGIQGGATANINNAGFIGAGTLSGGTTGTFTVNGTGSGAVFNGGYLTNGVGATIVGGNYGVYSGGTTAVNINNSGTITGGNYAIYLTGNNDNTISLYAGSATNGAIMLGNGNDTVNWYGGSFTSIEAGAIGFDRFNASVSTPTTLDLTKVRNFEQLSLNGGDLTLSGASANIGGWTVNDGTLTLDGTVQIGSDGNAVTLANSGTSLTIAHGATVIGNLGNGVFAQAGTTVTNAGLIRSTDANYSGVAMVGGTLGNQAGSLIVAEGNGVTVSAGANTITNAGIIVGRTGGVIGSDAYQTLNNTGIIVVGTAANTVTQYWQINQDYSTGDGVRFTAGGTVANTRGANNGGTIVGGANGLVITGGAATIENSGTIQGNTGYGVSLDTAAGQTSTITNHMSGAFVGTTGAVLLAGDGTINMTNEVGSAMYGSIVSTGNGTRNIDLSGLVYGDYDASSATGTNNVTMRSGQIRNVYLGDGDDSFTYFGGTITGIVDGGAGYDRLFADFGAGQSYNVSLANFINFDSIGLISGDMTLTGPSNDPDQAIYAGIGGMPAGTITFDGTSGLTGDIYVNGGSIRAATAGAFGSGTIHMIDPTATFGATGSYANNISLEVVTPSSANPSTLNADAGVTATLTGAITTGTGAGVDPSQDLVIGGQGTIILTNTANNWLGTTTIKSGATLQGASDTISGSAIVNNGTLAYQQAYSGTVTQNITGNGYVSVSGLAAGNALTFSGTNNLNGTFMVSDGSNIAISGATSTGNFQSVDLFGAGSRLDVTATGSLTSSANTVGTDGADQSVYNLGAITSTNNVAIYFGGTDGLLDNSGTISGTRAVWVNGGDAQLINRAGGTITGNSNFALYLGQGGTIDNSGTIQALNSSPAVYVAGTAAITNNAGGLITSQGTTIAAYGAGSSLTNAGSVTSSNETAVYLAAGGTVTNSGSLTGGTGGYGLWTSAGGTFTNQAGGTITGGLGGMYLDGANLVTVNLDAGSTTGKIFSGGTGDRVINILGTLNGGYAGGSGADAITLDTSAVVNGTLDGGAGNNTLTLTGTGSATLGAVANFGSATKSGSGTWTLGGATDVAAWTVTGGTLVTNGGAIADTASVALTGGTLQLGGSEAIGVLTGSGNVALGTSTLMLTSGTGSFTGNFNGTSGGLLIDGANLSFGGRVNYAGLTEIRSGTLTLTTGARFNATSTLLVDTAGTLDLGTTAITVGAARLDGTLNGTGTLAAHDIALNGATVNGNLSGNLLTQASGISHIAGTIDMDVRVSGGTLQLAANGRIADSSTVQVDGGATLDLQGFNDTIGALALGGTLAGTGTLTAGQYQLTGATVNANLGAGTLFNLGGNSTLNGTAAGDVSVQAGTLALGAANRLADAATVAVASGATLNLGAYSDTIGALALGGTLAGTGTLTAGQYQLTGATVNANLGAGTLFNLGGNSTLNGTAAGDVSVQAGTLALGASNRLADAATVAVASGATLNLGAYSDTIGALALGGTLAGTGTLTAGQYQLTGAMVNANLGAGTVFNLGGNSTLNGTAAGDVSVQGGTLALGAANRLADAATVAVASGATLNLGAYSDTVGALALGGTLAGTGTLTAGQYQLTGATVNANLGAGTLFNLGGNSTLNGTAAGDVSVQAGTLALGAANRLADAATVAVASGATLNLGTYSDTIGALALGGTLAGTGTLTAGQYQLTGATVNANLGAGTVYNLSGTSVLNGTAAANTVTVQSGTLRLGASDRLASTATIGLASGATFDLGAYNQTVAAIAGTGTIALGTGRLTLSSGSNTGFGGAITGSGSIDKQGTGTLTLAGTFATTGRFDVSAGTLAFSGSTQGGMRVQGGTLIGGGTMAGALTISSGTFSPGGLATGALGAINPIGSFTAGSLAVSGGTLLFDFGGASLNFASDSIKVNGTATLTGGTVQVNALTAAASDYRFNQLYTIVQANALTGTFANGSVFATVASNPNLKWRLRYDLAANAVVLQVQKNMEFNDGVAAGDTNTLAVANALGNSTTGNASDQWAATLNTITSLDTQQRVAAFRTFSGEALANVSTATISANNLFTDLLRRRVGDGGDALIGGGFASASLADVRTTSTAGNGFASALSGATLPGTDNGEAGNGGIWGQVYGGYQKLLGDGAHAGLDTTVAGVAMGVETRLDGFTAGIAGGVAQIDADMNSRYSTVSGNQYQLGGYLSYDAGSAFIAASGSWYSSDLNSKRTLAIGTTTALATGDIHANGYSVGVSGGFRTEFANGLRLALIGSASKVRDQRDGFTENATGGLGLQMAAANRDLFTAGAELRLGARVKTGAGMAMPWVSMGVRYNSGDLDTAGTVRFSGAPSGTGSFGVTGVRMAPVLGTLGVGIDAQASRNVRLGIALEGSAGENTREGRASVRVKIGF